MSNNQIIEGVDDKYIAKTNAGVILKLEYPFDIDGVEYKEIKVRYAKHRDTKAIRGLDAEKVADVIFVNLTELEESVIDEMNPHDIKRLDKIAADFLALATK
jgi:hypothetical protein